MKPWQNLSITLFLVVLGLIGCNGQVLQTQSQEAPALQTDTYTDENGLFTAQYPVDWAVYPYLFTTEFSMPFPNVAFSSSQEITELSLKDELLPEGDIGVGIMLMPTDMLAELGPSDGASIAETAEAAMIMMLEGEELPRSDIEVVKLDNGIEAAQFTIAGETETAHITIFSANDGVIAFASTILAPGYRNDALEARAQDIITSLQFTASAEEVMGFTAQMGTMDEAGDETTADNAAPTVTFSATEYAYDGPESIPGGLTRVELVNAGEQEHGLWLVKIDEGKGFEDFLGVMGAIETDPQFPSWLTFYGGVTAGPGDTAAYIIDLLPGSYTLFSFSGGESDEPDFAKGMMTMLSVTEGPETGAVPPTADLRTELVDYSYIIEGTPSAGPQVVEVTNAGTEPHEIALLKLAEEVTVQDALDFMMSGEIADGPPQFEFAGGVAPMSAGLTAWYEVDFEAGEYGFICFIPSPAQDGAPHFMLGMVQQVSVP